MPARASAQSAFIGRQPILTADLETVGYELLYREGDPQTVDGTRATSNVLLNAVIEFGLSNVTGHLPAWVNFPESYLVGNLDIPVDPDQLVVEVLEDVAPTDPVIARLAELKRRGYAIALDDFSYNPAFEEFLRLANWVKVDLRVFQGDDLARQVRALQNYDVCLVAEKVETTDEFEQCKALGFTLFQGFFFCQPEILEHRKIPGNRVAILRVLRELFDPNVEVRRVAELVAQDAPLSYRLLRMLNSAAFAVRQRVDSVHTAVVLLGLDMVRSLVTLLALDQAGDQPNELVTVALLRGRLCEQVAHMLNHDPPSKFFTVGLFSVLDALLQMPMTDLLDRVPIAPDVRGALLERAGPAGRVLDLVTAHERGDWEQLAEASIDPDDFRRAWLDAVAWAEEVQRSIGRKPSTNHGT